jgi:TorA maturation chaperone TorD
MDTALQPRTRGVEPAGPGDEDLLRAAAYRLLGRLLAAPPDGGLLGRLQAIEVPAEAGQGLAVAWRSLGLAAERASVEAVADEFQDLFIGLGRGELVPYGSWYLTGFLMERPLALLRRELAALGFERQPGVCEPEDHAGALCEVMAMLIGGAERAPHAQQQRFFEQHLGSWLGRFFADLRGARSGRFYRAVGQLGEQFIGVEQQYYAMLA